MPERPGLIGEADGSTLFLDEIGELPEQLQAHLLRVLDGGGEYQRLGEAATRRVDVPARRGDQPPARRRSSTTFSRASRIASRCPGCRERREDVPLVLARPAAPHRRAQQSADRAALLRAPQRRARRAAARADLVVRLLRHPFTHHVRELERLVWLALGTAEADYIGVTPDVDARARRRAGASPRPTRPTLDRDTLARALADHGRSPTRAAKALGLKNRYVLLRLLKKHGLSAAAEERSA